MGKTEQKQASKIAIAGLGTVGAGLINLIEQMQIMRKDNQSNRIAFADYCGIGARQNQRTPDRYFSISMV